MRNMMKRLSVMATAVGAFMLVATAAMAQEIGSAIESAATQVETEITAVLPTVFGVAAFLLVIGVAWRFFRRFVR